MRLILICVAILGGLTGPALVAGQSKPAPTGALTGVVVDGTSGEPVPDAVVVLAAVPARPIGGQSRQVTDEKGRFAFVNLPGDVNYTIAASAPGFLDGGYGRDTMPSDPLRSIPLKTDEWLPNVKVSIWRPGAISGTVRDESGEPVVGVVVRALQRVRIQGRDEFLAGPVTRTDDRGAYRLPNLPSARYLIQVPSVQAAMPASTRIEPPAEGVLNPQIFDDSQLRVMDVDDTARLVIGRYPLPPPPQNGRQFSYPAIFYPSASTIAESTTIALKFGEDYKRADLTLRPVVSVRVSGTVEGPPEALTRLSLRLLPAGLENVGLGAEVATALVGPKGVFTFLNVPAGMYTIDAPQSVIELTTTQGGIGPSRALAAPPTTPVHGSTGTKIELLPGVNLVQSSYRMSDGFGFSGRMPITVGGADVTGVVFRLRPHVTLTGQLVIETDPSGSGAQAPARFQIQIDPAGGEATLARTLVGGRGGGAGGQLTYPNIAPGHYLLHLTDTPGWVVKSVTWNGRDYTNQPFDLTSVDTPSGFVMTVTNAVPDLAGSVRDSENLKADATMVIAFPVEPSLWKNTGLWPSATKNTIVSSANRFQLRSLPAGEYYVAAISRSFSDTWREAEFLARVAPHATRVTLTWSGKSTLDLQAQVVR
jgi:hypothetical protein